MRETRFARTQIAEHLPLYKKRKTRLGLLYILYTKDGKKVEGENYPKASCKVLWISTKSVRPTISMTLRK